MKKRVDIKRIGGDYFIIDTTNNIKYQLDENICLIKQINDICDIINMKGEHYGNSRNKNRDEPKKGI